MMTIARSSDDEMDRLDADGHVDRRADERAEAESLAEQREQAEPEGDAADERDDDRRAVLDDDEPERLAPRQAEGPEVGDLDRPRRAGEGERGRHGERGVGEGDDARRR